MQETISAFSATPWCAALITSPDWVPVNTISRVPKPTTEDSFFAETLRTPRTVRNCLTLRPSEELDDGVFGDMVFGEVAMLIELGDGVNGHPKMAHGGFAATMLDEVMGALITLNIEAMGKRKERLGKLGPREPTTCFTVCEYLGVGRSPPPLSPRVGCDWQRAFETQALHHLDMGVRVRSLSRNWYFVI